MNEVLIGGVGSGLGQALALRYAREGAKETVQLIEGAAFFMLCDSTKQCDVDGLSLRLAERRSSLDLLVNSAGVATAGMLEFEGMDQWQWGLDINVSAKAFPVDGSIFKNNEKTNGTIFKI